MRKIYAAAFVLAICVAAIWLLRPSQKQGNQNPLAMKPVSLASSKNLWSTLVIIAKHEGYFAHEQLDVQIEYVQAAKFAMDSLVSSSTELSTVVEVNLAYLGFTGDNNVSVIATIVGSSDGAIIAREDAGIHIPPDLKGKRLGVLQGTTSQFFAERFLEKHGLSLADVDVRYLQPIAIQSAIVEGSIDAGSLWQPFTHNIFNALAGDATVFSDPAVYTGYMNIAVRKDWAEKNRDAVEGFLRALRQSELFVAKHPEQAQEIVAREINLDIATVKAIWSQYDFTLTIDKVRLVEAITDEAKWIHQTQRGFQDKPIVDYSGYIDTHFLSGIATHE